MQYEPIQIASTSSMQLRATHTKHVIIWTYKGGSKESKNRNGRSEETCLYVSPTF